MLARLLRPATSRVSSATIRSIMTDASPRGRGGRPFRISKQQISSVQQHFSAGPSLVQQRGVATAAATASSTPLESPIESMAPTPAITPRPLSPSAPTGAAFSTFVDRGLLSAETVAALPYEFTTVIQEQTLEPALQGKDLLARAKTGTGKTVAFLLPAIERYITRASKPGNDQVRILVLSPTRELAQQIAAEAGKLSAGRRALDVHCLVGGTNVGAEMRRLQRSPVVDIIAATPGRLIDHLENYNLQARLQGIQCLVLDEADRLLDQGFERDLQRILALLPKRKTSPRQTLFFSATMPDKVQKLASTFLLPDHVNISTVAENEDSTHSHVPQEIAYVEPTDLYAAAASLVTDALVADPQGKVIAFFPTAREVGLFADLFRSLMRRTGRTDIATFDIHSRKSQPQRDKALAAFRSTDKSVLFASDVAARGLDVPDVTAVFQIGAPPNAEQYVHRVGRTARAGKQGRGFLLLSKDQRAYMNMREMKELPVVPVDANSALLSPAAISQWHASIETAFVGMDNKLKEQAYQAWIGYHKSFVGKFKWSEIDLLNAANSYAMDVLRYQGDGDNAGRPPPLLAKTVGQMHIQNKHMLNIVKGLPHSDRGGQRSGQTPRGPSSSRPPYNAERPVRNYGNGSTSEATGEGSGGYRRGGGGGGGGSSRQPHWTGRGGGKTRASKPTA